MRIKEFIQDIIEVVVLAVPILFLTSSLVAGVETVNGSSMEPNFFTGQKIIIDKLTPKFNGYSRGDVVVSIPLQGDDKHFLKRVIGVPGDVFKVYNCKIYITRNGKRYILDEVYLAPNTCTHAGYSLTEGRSVKLEEGQYVLLGDNRGVSVDSRYFGVVPASEITGKVIFLVWPPKDFGFIGLEAAVNDTK